MKKLILLCSTAVVFPTAAFAQSTGSVEFEKENYGENNQMSYEFSRLVYNRKTPEKGFVIKTEKRGKSAADDR